MSLDLGSGAPGDDVTDLKADLWRRLREARSAVLHRLEGLSEHDRRRPMTRSGTNLLGLVKHLAGEEYGYLGETFDRPPSPRPPWFRDDPSDETDMWASIEESSELIIDWYRRAAAHADQTIDGLELDCPGLVRHWTDGQTTLGAMLILMISETCQHAGHADIVRELIDGTAGPPDTTPPKENRAHVQAIADRFR